MSERKLHLAQLSILRTLRHIPSARYSALRRPTGMESDMFKFHLRKLLQEGYVQKDERGTYGLTPLGKEYANNLSKKDRTVQKQPKLSVVIVVRQTHEGVTRYLLQRRLRHPFYGFWGCLSGPVQWGEAFESAARREVEKQTGIVADYTVRGFYRQTDYARSAEELLEDKLFVVMAATEVEGACHNHWANGHNAWMTLAELKAEEKYFTSTLTFIRMTEQDMTYEMQLARYSPHEY